MNALTPQSSKPLRPQVTCDLRKPLFILFSAYPNYATTQQESDARVEAYRIGLSGLPEWAVMEAVTRFVQGKVDRKSRDRLPTAEQVAAVSREILDAEAERRKVQIAIDQQRREREAERDAREHRPPTNERAEHVKRLLSQFKAAE